MADVNPYAVSSDRQDDIPDFSTPIYFAGIASRDDLLISLRDSPKTTGIRRFIGVAFGVLFFVFVTLLIRTEEGPTLWLYWLFLGATLLPIWIPIATKFVPGYRSRIRRLEQVAKSRTLGRGWLDQEQLVLQEGERSWVKATWDYFGPGHFFPNHFILPLKVDATRRIVIPCRHFYSAADAIAAGELIANQIGAFPQTKTDPVAIEALDEFSKVENSFQSFGKDWNIDHWPFESSTADQHDVIVNLSFANKFVRYSGLLSLVVFGFMLWFFLPVWITMAAWVIKQYREFGDWSFFWERPVAVMSGLIPLVILLGFILFAMLKSALASRRLTQSQMKFRLRDSGLCIVREGCESWMHWSGVESVLLEERSAGWVDADSKEEVRIPRECFIDQSEFEAFRDALSRFGDRRVASLEDA